MGKEPICNAGDTGDVGLSYGKLLQYSCLENLMDRGAWWAIVHRVTDMTEATEHTHTHARVCVCVCVCVCACSVRIYIPFFRGSF